MDLKEYTITYTGSIDDNFIVSVQSLVDSLKQAPDILTLQISSAGGSISSGITAYNYLKRLPYLLRCHNLGEVSSAAILPYLAGELRSAEKFSKFMIHPIEAPLDGNYPFFKIEEVFKNMNFDIVNYAEIVKLEAPAFSKKYEIYELLTHQSLILSSEEAKSVGIVSPTAPASEGL